MILVKMMGGLGNQMFQYAFAQELSCLYNEQVVYDLDFYKTDKQRKLAISSLNVSPLTDWREVFSQKEIARIRRKEKEYHLIQRICRQLHHSDRVGKKVYEHYLRQGCYFNFDPYYYSVPLLEAENKVCYGYFQGEPYFRHSIRRVKCQYKVRETLAETEKERLWREKIEQCNAVCIHIRVGDYKKAKNKRFDVITPEYLQRGMEYIKSHVAHPKFFVFTNDVEAVKSLYSLNDAEYVFGLCDYQDMRLMMCCKHHIISNSTFSWWTSYLAEYKEKIIVVPKKWRNNQETEPALMNSTGIDYIRL